jgi:hypothetical protein
MPSIYIYRSFETRESQIRICDFSGEMFKDFETLLSAMSATMTQVLSSGDFCKLRYDTIPLQSESANVLSIQVNKKCQILGCDTILANGRFTYPNASFTIALFAL